ncbi:hypothetical protein [Vibrio rotiferianus]|uniref:hypothetical protein n=1 Tax=Vibrio rotiferianus TaxID=190895 RepID=UPI001E4A0D1E|nr:hypothetical protein [Vibrio rotiferianus]
MADRKKPAKNTFTGEKRAPNWCLFILEVVERPYHTDNRLGERLTTSATNGAKVNIVVIIVKMLILQSMISLSLVQIVNVLFVCVFTVQNAAFDNKTHHEPHVYHLNWLYKTRHTAFVTVHICT